MPVVTYVDPDTVHNPASGTVAPASWFTTHEANFRSIVGRVSCKIRSSANQTLTGNGTDTITLGTVDHNNGMTTSTANTITVPSSYGGKYLIAAQLRADGTTPGVVGTFTVEVRVNGTAVHQDRIHIASGGTMAFGSAPCFVHALSVADAVTLVTVTTGFNLGSIATQTANAWCSLSCTWLSA